MQKRPPIPEPIKRQVRQECHFGCVICGSPVFEYDHMVPYAQVKEHKPENLALLCEKHHSAKTSKKLSLERVLEGRKNPFNANTTAARGYRVEKDRTISVNFGTCGDKLIMFEEDMEHSVFWISGLSYFTIHKENGWISFSMAITDAKGLPCLIVLKGEIILNTGVWDYSYHGNTLIIRSQSKEILFKAKISSNMINIFKAFFISPKGDGFIINKGKLHLVDTKHVQTLSGIHTMSPYGGFAIINDQDFPIENFPKEVFPWAIRTSH